MQRQIHHICRHLNGVYMAIEDQIYSGAVARRGFVSVRAQRQSVLREATGWCHPLMLRLKSPIMMSGIAWRPTSVGFTDMRWMDVRNRSPCASTGASTGGRSFQRAFRARTRTPPAICRRLQNVFPSQFPEPVRLWLHPVAALRTLESHKIK